MSKIPSRQECLNLLKKYGYYKESVPIVHAELVERTAVNLSLMLIEKGIAIDRPVVACAALIHDIGKEDKGHHDHAERGFQICVKEDLDPKICLCVKNHDVEGVLHPMHSWEEKIVAYADKLCNTRLLGLENRFHDWITRFPENYQRHREMLDRSHAKSLILEKEILNKLGLSTEELYNLLREKNGKGLL